MKRCFKCERELPLGEFYRHAQMADGHLGKCKDCAKRDVQSNYRKTIKAKHTYDKCRQQLPNRRNNKAVYLRSHRKKHPMRYKARQSISNAIRSGWLKRLPCCICNDPKSEAHHFDYSRPFDIAWLCLYHHRKTEGRVAA